MAAQPAQSARPSEVVASYSLYADATRAVEFLADQRFPVEHVAIVAGGLRFVERVTGRIGYAGAALRGVASGAMTGAFIGFVLGLFSVVAPLRSALGLLVWGLALGAVFGAVTAALWHALTGARELESHAGFQADHFDVVATPAMADRARGILARFPAPRVA